MSIAFAETKLVTRASGRGVAAHLAYRAGTKVGNSNDFSRRKQTIAAEYFVGWAGDHASFAKAVETSEKRNDSRLLREIIWALPEDATAEQRAEIVRAEADSLRERYGVALHVAIHEPRPRDGQTLPASGKNYHAHLSMTTRPVDATGVFGSKKVTALDKEMWLDAEKDRLLAAVNSVAATASERGPKYGGEAQPKLGRAYGLERAAEARGEPVQTDAGEQYRAWSRRARDPHIALAEASATAEREVAQADAELAAAEREVAAAQTAAAWAEREVEAAAVGHRIAARMLVEVAADAKAEEELGRRIFELVRVAKAKEAEAKAERDRLAQVEADRLAKIAAAEAAEKQQLDELAVEKAAAEAERLALAKVEAAKAEQLIYAQQSAAIALAAENECQLVAAALAFAADADSSGLRADPPAHAPGLDTSGGAHAPGQSGPRAGPSDSGARPGARRGSVVARLIERVRGLARLCQSRISRRRAVRGGRREEMDTPSIHKGLVGQGSGRGGLPPDFHQLRGYEDKASSVAGGGFVQGAQGTGALQTENRELTEFQPPERFSPEWEAWIVAQAQGDLAAARSAAETSQTVAPATPPAVLDRLAEIQAPAQAIPTELTPKPVSQLPPLSPVGSGTAERDRNKGQTKGGR